MSLDIYGPKIRSFWKSGKHLHILSVWQAQMLLGGHIAKHGCPRSANGQWQTQQTAGSHQWQTQLCSPHGTDVGSTDGASNVIVAGGNVCGQRP